MKFNRNWRLSCIKVVVQCMMASLFLAAFLSAKRIHSYEHSVKLSNLHNETLIKSSSADEYLLTDFCYASNPISHVGVVGADNVSGPVDNVYADLHDDGDEFVIDLGFEYPIGTQINIFSRLENGAIASQISMTVSFILEDNIGYNSVVVTDTQNNQVNASIPFRYLKIQKLSSVGFEVDAIEIECNNSDSDGDSVKDIVDVDDDNDGILDFYEAGGSVCNMSYGYSNGVPEMSRDRTFPNDLDRDLVFGDHFGFQITFDQTIPVVIQTTIGDNRYNRKGTVTVSGITEEVETAYGSYQTVIHIPPSSNSYTMEFDRSPEIGDLSVTRIKITDLDNNVIAQFDFGTDTSPLESGYIRVTHDTQTTNTTYLCNYDLSSDADTDGIPNRLDLDSDNDGILDNVEAQTTAGYIALSGIVGSNGYDNAYETSVDSGVSNFSLVNSDSDSNSDYLDIDSDNDGIPDNVEAQTTLGYIIPSGGVGVNGIYDVYDSDDTMMATALIPVNTDGTDVPDYRDSDTDNDGTNDILEKGGVNNLSNNDADGDGLDDNFDEDNSNYNVNNNINTPFTDLPDADGDVANGGNVDYRDDLAGVDTDGDSIKDDADLDDDNDGILDVNERVGKLGFLDLTQFSATQSSTNYGAGADFAIDGNTDGDFVPNDPNNSVTHTTREDNPWWKVDLETYRQIDNIIVWNRTDDNVGHRLNDYILEVLNVSEQVVYTYQHTHNYTGTDTFVRDTITNINTSGRYVRIRLEKNNERLSITELQIFTFDHDQDGIPNRKDLDSDNDGILDNIEAQTIGGYIAPSGNVGSNGYDNAYETSVDSGVSSLTLVNSDSDAHNDFIDIDSDDDGIPDNVEAQTTLGYVIPSGAVGMNGIYDVYDSDDTMTATALNPINTDGTDLPDFRDQDTDNDGTNDLNENGEGNVLSGSDLDGDGLDNNYDADNVNYNVNDNINTPSSDLPDEDNDANTDGDVDYRDAVTGPDNDGDGIPDLIDIDDDNDGILDAFECSEITLVPQNHTYAQNTFYPERAYDSNPNSSADLSADTTQGILVIDLGGILPSGTKVNFTASMFYDQSISFRVRQSDHLGLNTSNTKTYTINSEDIEEFEYTLSSISQYIRFEVHINEVVVGSPEGISIHNITYQECIDVDSDTDGIVDRLDLDSDNDGILDNIEAQSTSGYIVPSGSVGSNGYDDVYETSVDNGVPNFTIMNSDSDAKSDFLDIDSDNDGIPDNVEAQVTLGYIAPSGGVGNNGIYDVYESDDTLTASALIPENTDSSDVPDYRDTNSDNEGVGDLEENTPGITLSNSDTDGDGLDDHLDADNNNYNVNNNINNPSTDLPDGDNDVNINGDINYRDDLEGLDTDGDRIIDDVDIDDDNDGILDFIDAGGSVHNITYELTGVIDGSRDRTLPNDLDKDFIFGDDYGFQITFDQVTPVMIETTIGDLNHARKGTVTVLGVVQNIDVAQGSFQTVSHTPTSANSYLIELRRDPEVGDLSVTRIKVTDLENNVIAQFDFGTPTSTVEPNYIGVTHDTPLTNTTYTTSYDLSADSDGDGIPNRLDIDSDNDGIPDNIEAQTTSVYMARTNTDTDNDGLDDAYDPDNGGTTITPTNTDGSLTNSDDIPDFLDIDVDNDGIPDNIEVQTTNNYIAPSGTVGLNGLDDAYDFNDIFTAVGLSGNLINTDSDSEPDFRDTDADGDGTNDVEEGLTNINSGTFGTDTDNDGLDDLYEGSVDNDGFDVNDEITDPSAGGLVDDDADANANGDVDYRDTLIGTDSDNDGVIDSVDIDDDNDGILDILESIEVAVDSFVKVRPIYHEPASDLDITRSYDNDENSFYTIPGWPHDYRVYFENTVPAGSILSMKGERIGPYYSNIQFNDPNGYVAIPVGGSGSPGPIAFDEINEITTQSAVTQYDADYYWISSEHLSPTNIYDIYYQEPAIIMVPEDIDTDGDGIPNRIDLDSDNDGIPDNVEAQLTAGYIAPTGTDTDGDGLDDAYDPNNGGTSLVLTDTDVDGVTDYIDIDSDNDGIPDNVEAQSTLGYQEPSNTLGTNGMDANYEDNDSYLAIGLQPQNTDGTGEPDYRDTDSDDDGILDIQENGDSDTIVSNTDTDGDGLDDNFDDFSGFDVNDDISNPAQDLPDIDGDLFSSGDVDYRDATSEFDTDNDGILDSVDLDDDNDGILDSVENVPTVLDLSEFTATQSSIEYGAGPGYAIDGNTNGDLLENDPFNSVTSTQIQANPWWRIDLESDIHIERIIVWNRTDDNQGHQLNDFILEILDVSEQVIYTYQHTHSYLGTETFESHTILNVNTVGRYVRVRLEKSNVRLSIAEVQLLNFDNDADGIPNALDIDSDNDGIPDNVEAQSTTGYVAPSGIGLGMTDTNNDGVDDLYAGGLTPVNTDSSLTNSDDTLDYLDTDSDGDGINDISENGFTDLSDTGDFDGDGLQNRFEGLNIDDSDVNDEINDPLTDLPDEDADANGDDDVDYRDEDNDNSSPSLLDNLIWLRSDIGLTVVENVVKLWQDQGLNNLPFVERSSQGNGPSLNSNGLNFHPTLTFSEVQNAFLAINDWDAGNEGVNIFGDNTNHDEFWIYTVNSSNQDDYGHIFSQEIGTAVNNRIYFDTRSTVPTTLLLFFLVPDTTWGISNNWTSATQTHYIWNAGFASQSSQSPSNTNMSIYRNGLLMATSALGAGESFFVGEGSASNENSTAIGINLPNNQSFHGDLAELMVFTSAPSSQEQQLIHSYLGLKYGITLDPTDNDASITEGDYTFAGGVTAWDYSANNLFHNDVAGIGRNDEMLLLQKQSKSNGTNAILTVGLGSIAANNASNAESINSNNSFLIWGHNGGALNATASGNSFCGSEDQLDRIWKVQETGNIGITQIAIEKTVGESVFGVNSELSLKIAADESFATNVIHVPLEIQVINGVEYYTASHNFNGVQYLTFSKLIDAIVWDGASSSWSGGGSGENGQPNSNDSNKPVIIDARSSGNHAVLESSAQVKCLWIKSNSKLIVNSDLSLQISEDFVLDGEVRLIGDAQLIQTHTGVSNVQGNGKILRDQQAFVPNTYRYHYWSSPVVENNGDNSYQVGQVMKDGTRPTSKDSEIIDINFQSYNGTLTSLNGAPTDPITIADYWIFGFYNGVVRNDWYQITSTGNINVGEGYTMKSTGRSPQNFTFYGSPNDGDITKTLTPGTTSLLGNPYPSTIDTQKFIADNSEVIDGTLYFWEHKGESTTTDVAIEGHGRYGYVGGYSHRNHAMGVAANSIVDGTAGLGTGSYKEPSRYVAVGQGFFVSVPETKGGELKFDNSQRAANMDNVFFRNDESTEDLPNFKIGMDYINDTNAEVHRQLGVNFKEGNTFAYESGYDSQTFDLQPTDIYWDFEEIESNLVIAGVGEITAEMQIPLGFNIDTEYPVKIMIDDIDNMEGYLVYFVDLVSGQVFNLENEVELVLPVGEYNNRFILAFGGNALGTDTVTSVRKFSAYFDNTSQDLVINKSEDFMINKVEVYSLLGNQLYTNTKIENHQEIRLRMRPLPTAMYVVVVHTDQGTISRKIIFY